MFFFNATIPGKYEFKLNNKKVCSNTKKKINYFFFLIDLSYFVFSLSF